MAPARGGDRSDRSGRARCPIPRGRILAAVVVALGLGLTSSPPSAWASGSSSSGPAASGPAATAASVSSPAALRLHALPTIAGPSNPFSLRLGVSDGVSLAKLTLGITVYKHVVDPSEFDETLNGTPVGAVVAQSDAIALSTLTPDAADPQRGVDLSVPVTAGAVAGAGTGPFTVHLPCSVGSCGGVYPVRLVLTDAATHTVTSRLLTYLVYTDPSADTEPLRFALVVPLAMRLTSTSSQGAVVPVTSSSLAPLTNLLGSLSGPRATVPVTLEPSPATTAALAGARGAKAKQALASLVSLTAEPARQTLCSSYIPVSAGAFDAADLGTELAEQVHGGAQVLNAIPGLHASSCATDNAWVSTTTLDNGAIATLASLGYTRLVVPPSAVSGPSPSTTPTRRFTLGTGAPGNAVLSDSEVSSRLQPTLRSDPALAADQLLAELELDYYEAPNTSQARGVVAVAPPTTAADPAVIADVLDGLQNNPMVEPVTLATLFSDTAQGVPVGGVVGGVTQPSARRPAAVGGATLPARAIKTARLQWTGFAAAVAGSNPGTAVATALNDLLLGAESQQLTPTEQSVGVTHFEAAMDHQLTLLSVTSREARLTASTGSVPITVIKNAPYPVKAVLSLTSDKIVFSPSSAQAPNTECAPPTVTGSASTSSVSSQSSISMQCTFVHGTNAVYIEMQSRVSGDFRLTVTLASPEGGLQLASGQLTVKSMSTSAVAIALSVVAGFVLLGWWARTIWRGRRSRRGAHRRRSGSTA